MLPTRGLAVFGMLAVATGAAGCHSDPLPGPNPPAATTLASAPAKSAGTGETTIYVNLPPGTVPDGLAAAIRNLTRRTSGSAYPVAGGFDPVPVNANPGDNIEIEVRGPGGRTLLDTVVAVPAVARPIVVRTDPPPRKRDVPLNAAFLVVFSEPVDPRSLTPGSIGVVGSGGPVAGQLVLEEGGGGLRARFVPSQALQPNTTYHIQYTENVVDLKGNHLEPGEQEFTTGTATVPTGLSRIAFGACPTGDDDVCGIFSLNADGSDLRQLSDPLTSGQLDAAWSPDGTKIAFSGFRHCLFGPAGRCVSEIYVMNADGSAITRLTNRPDTSSYLPTWSPDGRRIAFQSTAFSANGNITAVDIFAMDADGTNRVRLTSDPAEHLSPAWSPDGTRIAFVTDRDGNNEIYVMGTDGSNPVRLTADPGDDGAPAWSPDGGSIAFSTNRDGNYEIYVMRADGTGPRRLTSDPENDFGATWSPDGRRIAFASGRDGGGLFVMNADGSGVTRIYAAFAAHPSWSPIGLVPAGSGRR